MTNYLEKIKINNTEYEIRAPRAKGDEDGNNIKSTYMTKSPATDSTIGGVKIGDGINVANDGTISAILRNIGEIVFSPFELTDSGLHLLDGAELSGSGSYADFVEYIGDLYDSGDYTSIFTTEANWQSAVSSNGVCGKFVYTAESGNTPAKVRLPKYSNKIYTSLNASVPAKGNGMSIGITDGTNNGALDAANYYLHVNQGKYGEAVGTATTTQNAFTAKTLGITTDGTKSGIIADLSAITTALDGYYYIVVATTAKTAVQVDIDEIATDLNGKADKDLSNVSNTSGFRKLIELGNNGTAGYKIFREYDPQTGNYVGLWCEERGETEGTAGERNIHFTNTFKDTNYYVGLVWGTTNSFNSAGVSVQNMSLVNASKTGFSIKSGSVAIPIRWKVEGYLEEE